MRVISGKVRGLKLSAPDGDKTRPTLDRVREAVFSMLLPYLNGANVLDLFAGSGAIGIEALSRGANNAVFIDNSERAINCIKKNLNNAKLSDKASVVLSDSKKYLTNCVTQYDLIFLDPPYSKGLYTPTLQLIYENKLLCDDGLIILEWDYEVGLPKEFFGFEILKEKKYGRVGVTVLKWGLTE